MTRMPRLTGRVVLAALRRGGFGLDRVNGSHHILLGPQGQRVTVPVHTGETLHPKTLSTILAQAGLTLEQFVELL